METEAERLWYESLIRSRAIQRKAAEEFLGGSTGLEREMRMELVEHLRARAALLEKPEETQ